MRASTQQTNKPMPIGQPPYGKLGRCLHSLDAVLWVHGRTSADGKRRISANTAKQRAQDLKLCLRLLHEAGRPIVDVRNLRTRHFKVVADEMVRRGYSAATMQKFFTHLARLCDAIGKPGMIGDPRQYFDDPAVYERHYAARIPETLPVPRLDIDAVIAAAYAKDTRCGIWLELCHYFGMRVTEAIRFRPRERDETEFIYFRGVKNRLYRTVPVETDAQRDLLERARAMAPDKSASLIPADKTLKQARNRFRNVMKRIGLTTKQLGATPHALRHGYARRLYRQLTGQLCPAEGGQCIGMSRAQDRDVRIIIAERLGHSRESITCAYLGPILTSERKKVA